MKTKQEQIKEIADVLCDYCKNNTKIGEPCKSSNGTYICTSEIRRATAIVQAGYGDVSEYKAEREMLGSQIKVLKQRLNNKYVEIERLKSELKQLQTNAEILARGVRDLNHENYKLTKKLKARLTRDFAKKAQKQAQIDILNKLKSKTWHGYQIGMYVVSIEDIDELIKEVQNGKDKG